MITISKNQAEGGLTTLLHRGSRPSTAMMFSPTKLIFPQSTAMVSCDCAISLRSKSWSFTSLALQKQRRRRRGEGRNPLSQWGSCKIDFFVELPPLQRTSISLSWPFSGHNPTSKHNCGHLCLHWPVPFVFRWFVRPASSFTDFFLVNRKLRKS